MRIKKNNNIISFSLFKIVLLQIMATYLSFEGGVILKFTEGHVLTLLPPL